MPPEPRPQVTNFTLKNNQIVLTIKIEGFATGEPIELSGHATQEGGAFAVFNDLQIVPEPNPDNTITMYVTALSSQNFEKGHPVTVVLRAARVWATVLGETQPEQGPSREQTGKARPTRRAVPGTMVNGLTDEIIYDLLPRGFPATNDLDPSIRGYATDLPEPYDRALLWTAAIEASLNNRPLSVEIPDGAVTTFGFVWQEESKPGLAAVFRWPGWIGPPRQIGEINVSETDVTVPIFATRLIRYPQALPHPPRGLRTCFFRSNLEEEQQLFLTAAHVLDPVQAEDEIRSGVEVRLAGSKSGRIVEADPNIMDAALVAVLNYEAAEATGIDIAEFVAPGQEVVVAKRGGPSLTRISHVSGPAKGIINAQPHVMPRLQSIVFLEDSFNDGDSGALVMNKRRTEGISMYQGVINEWKPEDRIGYGVLLRQPLTVFDLINRAEIEADVRDGAP